MSGQASGLIRAVRDTVRGPVVLGLVVEDAWVVDWPPYAGRWAGWRTRGVWLPRDARRVWREMVRAGWDLEWLA